MCARMGWIFWEWSLLVLCNSKKKIKHPLTGSKIPHGMFPLISFYSPSFDFITFQFNFWGFISGKSELCGFNDPKISIKFLTSGGPKAPKTTQILPNQNILDWGKKGEFNCNSFPIPSHCFQRIPGASLRILEIPWNPCSWGVLK